MSKHPEIYSNPGYGTVLQNPNRAAQLAELFEQKATWTSRELNELIGWQFSQAVFSLRRLGWEINTLRLGYKNFAYSLVSSGRDPLTRKPRQPKELGVVCVCGLRVPSLTTHTCLHAAVSS